MEQKSGRKQALKDQVVLTRASLGPFFTNKSLEEEKEALSGI